MNFESNEWENDTKPMGLNGLEGNGEKKKEKRTRLNERKQTKKKEKKILKLYYWKT